MISRRALLGTGVGVAGGAGLLVVADRTHRLDDLADAVGLDPRPQSVPRDDELLRRAHAAQVGVLLQVRETARVHGALAAPLGTIAALVAEQVAALGAPAEGDPDAVAAAQRVAVVQLARSLRAHSRRRAEQSVAAAAPELAVVLASMSAGLAQCSTAVGRLA